MLTAFRRPNRQRRGVTLVEMLVVVALVVLMMVILVQIFQQALGAMSASRTTQELDVVLRGVDSMLRSDLAGVTAQMTPPNNPDKKQGYFEYGENAPADLQGEDTDDWLAFTSKRREGESFTGRQWLSNVVNNVQLINQAIQPTTINSQVAEVIYFLRNGNLYRRVLLVAPDRVKTVSTGIVNNLPNNTGLFQTSMFGNALNVSWQGMNDISCRPGGFNGSAGQLPPIPNDLGDLTNRENRYSRPRFVNDFGGGTNNTPDGIPDDNNADGVPDYYPTLYYDGVGNPQQNIGWAPNRLVNEFVAYPSAFPRVEASTANSYDVYAFPFIYPGMYSVPDPNRVGNKLGWVHYLPPNTNGYINHSPLDIGDTPLLALPSGGNQTWWGFPTWRETMTGTSTGVIKGWRDPINFVSLNGNQQPLGLKPFNPTSSPALNSATFLPSVTATGTTTTPFGFDAAGSTSFVANPTAPNHLWEDDLILSNVRSFDVKAYDPDAPLYNTAANGLFSAGYQDLGYGSASYVAGWASVNGSPVVPPFQAVPGGTNWTEPRGFGHEGRIPAAFNDFRSHPTRGINIGDDRPGVIRLTRTFDTWSTAYMKTWETDIFNNGSTGAPIYPAFPPPYPSALRGIQIQIRVVDPRNERSKVLTIRHDFSDKLSN